MRISDWSSTCSLPISGNRSRNTARSPNRSSSWPSSLPVPDPSADCHVNKFGGSSLADAARYRLATELIGDDAHTCLVVVSAMQGTTDALLALANATRANKAWHGAWSALRQRHLDAASALDPGDVHGLCAEIEDELEGLHRTLVALAAGDPDAARAAPGLPGLGDRKSDGEG